MLTQTELKKLVVYCQETGQFSRAAAPDKQIGCVNGEGYVVFRVAGKLYLAHRLAWLFVHGRWPREIDHIDRNRSNNAWLNIREVTRSENNLNLGVRSDNTSGHKGVGWSRQRGKWYARIRVSGRLKHLGFYSEIEEAAAAYRSASTHLATLPTEQRWRH